MKAEYKFLGTLAVGFIVLMTGIFAISIHLVADQPNGPAQLPPGLEAIHEWLGKLDDGHYEECWKDGGKLLHDTVTLDQWVKDDTDQRKRFGKCTSRALVEARPHNRFRLRDGTAIDGQFVEVLFKTNFELQSNVTESISAMQEADGIWRVFAYDARPHQP